MPDRLPTFRPPWVNRKPRRDATPRDQTAAGYGRRAWKLARQERLMLDNWQCQECRRVVTGREAHVDHLVPKAAGGSDLMDNLRTLCRSCHSRKTVREEQGGRIGPSTSAEKFLSTLLNRERGRQRKRVGQIL